MQVDFYILSDAAPDAHLRYACRLAEQAVDQGHSVFIRLTDANAAKRMDDLLWTFGDRSFLPHEFTTLGAPSHPRVRVLIGAVQPGDFGDVLINLSADVPPSSELPERIIECVPADPQGKQLARERFKAYRARGIEPATHTV